MKVNVLCPDSLPPPHTQSWCGLGGGERNYSSCQESNLHHPVVFTDCLYYLIFAKFAWKYKFK
jgi:hypothetical protein